MEGAARTEKCANRTIKNSHIDKAHFALRLPVIPVIYALDHLIVGFKQNVSRYANTILVGISHTTQLLLAQPIWLSQVSYGFLQKQLIYIQGDSGGVTATDGAHF
jgi:hypothetical protein